MQIMHWAYRLAEELQQRKPSGKIVVTSGITTSGPAHLGTVVEGLFPAIITKATREQGREVSFHFIADILDAFDGIPRDLLQYKDVLEPHLGKPLCNVPDPYDCHKSYGEHFFQEVLATLKSMGSEPTPERANLLYAKGLFDDDTLLYLRKIEAIKEILETVSGRNLKKDWNPIMPICKQCGKIATTRVISYDLFGNYKYACDVDLEYTKGCNDIGEANIREHMYKLQWRLHWPSWQKYFDTDIEGGGVDHFTKGGSWDTAVAIHKQVLNREPPIGYKFGFIMEQGKKMSKSKGVILTVKDMLKLLPPRVIAYQLLKGDLEENIDFTPSKENLLKLIDDYETVAQSKSKTELTRAEEKKLAAYHLAGELQWKGKFQDPLLYYSISRDWKKVEQHIGNVDNHIKPYIENWFAMNYVPEDYDFTYKPSKAEGIVRELISSLQDGMDGLAVHNAVYEFAKSKNIGGPELFKKTYMTLIGKEKGPRLGRLIAALGIAQVKKDTL